MALDKAILHGKEKRKIYRDSRAFDHTCRNHGSCVWCECNRKYNGRKRDIASKDKLNEYLHQL